MTQNGYPFQFVGADSVGADQLTALGITAVKKLSTSSFSEGTLTLNFADATTVEAGKPYLVFPKV